MDITQAHISEIVDSLPYRTFWIDSETHNFVGYNKIYHEFLNQIKKSDCLGESIFEVLPNEYSNILSYIITEISKTSKPLTLPMHLKEIFESEVLITGTPIQVDGAIKFILFTERLSLTEASWAKYILNEKENTETYLENIINNLPVSVYWKNKKGVIIGDNLLHAQMSGFNSREEAIGKTDYDYHWKDQAHEIVKNDKDVMSTKIPTQFEETALLSDGKTHTFLTTKTPLLNKKNKSIGVLGISMDITERKEMEVELQKAKKGAEQANNAKTEFLANMSHDIRTPITGMIGLIQTIYDNQNAPEIIESNSQYLMSSTEELLKLLNEIIEVSKSEIDHEKIQSTDFNLKEIITTLIKLFSPTIVDKQIEIKHNFSENIPECYESDRSKVKRVILNVISNAIKFTEKGSISIIVTGEVTNNDMVEVNIKISDTGIGIPQDKIDTIFAQFTKINSSYNGKYKGYGLGLYTVKKYLDSLGGTIDVESEYGKGTVFNINLPLKISHSQNIHEEVQELFKRDAPKANKIKEPKVNYYSSDAKNNILLVEDNKLAANMVAKLFADLACDIETAVSGGEALEKVKAKKFDLILLDLGLPDMDGFDVCTHIKEPDNQYNTKTPIVALSGHLGNNYSAKCLSAGMNEYLTKPISVSQVNDIYDKYIKQTPAQEDKPKALSVIDLEFGAKLTKSTPDEAKQFIDFLVESLSEERTAMEKAFRGKDLESLYKIVHKFYGGLVYCGVPKLKAAAHDLHEAILPSNCKDIKVIEKLFKSLLLSMDELVGEHSKLEERS